MKKNNFYKYILIFLTTFYVTLSTKAYSENIDELYKKLTFLVKC